MRLAQLARKISVRPSQIIDLLAQDQLFFEDGTNAKLNDEVVRKVLLALAPHQLSEIMAEQVAEAAMETEPPAENNVTEQETVVASELNLVAPVVTVNTTEEIIRAPKVELAGLKVLGKIELPQARKQEETKVKAEDADATVKREQRERRPRQKREEKPWRNPIALQREQEAREIEEKKQAALKEKKERKRQHYMTRVKPAKPIKAARIFDEPEQQKAQQAPEAKPRTWFGKFLKWLNT